MAIYVTGDIHGNPSRLNTASFPEQRTMTKEDVVIILGDFGIVWESQESKQEKYWLDWLESKNFTTVFVSGNHENYTALNNNYPVKGWNGGLVHEIRPSVLHLITGEVFNIQDCKIFAFGGASSHDIRDGILDPDNFVDKEDFRDEYRKWINDNKLFRVKGISWWPEEIPSLTEQETGLSNLAKYNFEVDYIVTHSPNNLELSIMDGGAGLYKPDQLTNYLSDVCAKTQFKKHFFGHMHDDRQVTHNGICLYWQITRIW